MAFSTRLADPWTPSARPEKGADYPFKLGVASGDPLPQGVMLWTRLARDPLDALGGLTYARRSVDWEVARDDGFKRVVRRGTATARPEYGHSVHVDVRGLRPGREYFYRFRQGGEISPVGRTRTAPEPGARVDRVRVGMCSCSSWPDGFYTSYRHLAAEELDVVFHLGDYIYEYGIAPDGAARKTPVPDQFRVQCDTLDRYRVQYGLYKSDTDLQAAHAAHPWVVTWDDHDVLDNWASKHGPGGEVSEQDFLVIRANAFRAFWENLPIRLPSRPQGPDMRIYRRYGYGDLAGFNVLDTRQYRSDQVCGDAQAVDCQDRLDPSRTMLGDEQERWLLRRTARSRARWNVLVQQVAMSQLDYDPGEKQRLSMDLWDGYKPAKERVLLGMAGRKVRNPTVLSGDLHYSMAGNLKRDFDDPSSETIGVEFIGTSISSGGNGGTASDIPPGQHHPINDHIRFASFQRGYVRHEISRDRWRADFRVVPYIDRPGAPIETRGSLVTFDGRPGLEKA